MLYKMPYATYFSKKVQLSTIDLESINHVNKACLNWQRKETLPAMYHVYSTTMFAQSHLFESIPIWLS